MWRKSLMDCFRLSQVTIEKNMEGVSQEESLVAPGPKGNCMNWAAGHILSTRDYLLSVLGGKTFLAEEEAKGYRRGSSPIEPGSPCVQIDKLRKGLDETLKTLLGILESTEKEDLDELLKPSDFPVPVETPARGCLLTLILFHEGYHSGQMGICRRVLGKESALK